MTRLFLLLAFLFVSPALLLIGCEKSSKSPLILPIQSPENPENPESKKKREVIETQTFQYHLIQDGCPTGSQSFNTLEETCQGLRSQKVNKACAVDLRKKKFKEFGCPGHFELIEDFDEDSDKDMYLRVRCRGSVTNKQEDGSKGYASIDKTINWDGKTPQKIILVNFGEPKHAGEHSVVLIPPDEKNPLGQMKVGALGIDNIKTQVVIGHLASELYFSHREKFYTQTSSELTCAPLNHPQWLPELKALKEKTSIHCLGTNKKSSEQIILMSGKFIWDGQSSLKSPLTVRQSTSENTWNDLKDTGLFIELKKDENGFPSLTLIQENLDGHTDFRGSASKSLSLSINHLSAVDNREVLLYCFAEDEENAK